MIVVDHRGIWHEVYNKREVREIQQRTSKNFVERWQVRVRCRPDDSRAVAVGDDHRFRPAFFGTETDFVTCVRCLCTECDHGITFDPNAAQHLAAADVRRHWPRLDGECKKGCGYVGIYYASFAHYVYGDW